MAIIDVLVHKIKKLLSILLSVGIGLLRFSDFKARCLVFCPSPTPKKKPSWFHRYDTS